MDIYLDASRLGIYPPLFTSPSGNSCILLLFIHFLIFLRCLHFSGVHRESSEFVDISNLPSWRVKNLVRGVFVRSGFANKTKMDKLGPCPLGTFVDSSRADPSCQHCPAGKLELLTLYNSFQ